MTDLTYRSPKTEVRNSSIHGKGLFAKAPIEQGEIVAVKGGYILCGSANCRGTITGKDWMKKDLQEKYKGWFCWFLQRKIDALVRY